MRDRMGDAGQRDGVGEIREPAAAGIEVEEVERDLLRQPGLSEARASADRDEPPLTRAQEVFHTSRFAFAASSSGTSVSRMKSDCRK